MPGYAHELAAARREGLRLLERGRAKELVRDARGRLTALKLVDDASCRATSSSSASGSPSCASWRRSSRGSRWTTRPVKADPKTRQARETPRYSRVGDVLGGELVVTAVQDAKRAARAMCALLGIRLIPDAPVLAGHV